VDFIAYFPKMATQRPESAALSPITVRRVLVLRDKDLLLDHPCGFDAWWSGRTWKSDLASALLVTCRQMGQDMGAGAALRLRFSPTLSDDSARDGMPLLDIRVMDVSSDTFQRHRLFVAIVFSIDGSCTALADSVIAAFQTSTLEKLCKACAGVVSASGVLPEARSLTALLQPIVEQQNLRAREECA
jgi:hypothetical protein